MLEHHVVDVHATRPVLLVADRGARFGAALGVWVSPGGPLEQLAAAGGMPLADLDAAPAGGRPGVTLRLRNDQVALSLRLPLGPVLLAAAGQALDPDGDPALMLALCDTDAPGDLDEVVLGVDQAHVLMVPVIAVRDAAAGQLSPAQLDLLERVVALGQPGRPSGAGPAHDLVAQVVADTVAARARGTHPDALHDLLAALPSRPALATEFLAAAGQALAAAVRDLLPGEVSDAAAEVQEELPGAGLLLALAYADVLCAEVEDPDELVEELPTAGLETPEDVAQDWAPQRWRALTGRGRDAAGDADTVEVTVALLAWLVEEAVEDPAETDPDEVAELLAWGEDEAEATLSALMSGLDVLVRRAEAQCWAVAACQAVGDEAAARAVATATDSPLATMPHPGATNLAARLLQDLAGAVPDAVRAQALAQAAAAAPSPQADLLTALADGPQALLPLLTVGEQVPGAAETAELAELPEAVDRALELTGAAGALARAWDALAGPGAPAGPVTVLTEALEHLVGGIAQVPLVLTASAPTGAAVLRQLAVAAGEAGDEQESAMVGDLLLDLVEAAEETVEVDREAVLAEAGVRPEAAAATTRLLDAGIGEAEPLGEAVLDALAALLLALVGQLVTEDVAPDPGTMLAALLRGASGEAA